MFWKKVIFFMKTAKNVFGLYDHFLGEGARYAKNMSNFCYHKLGAEDFFTELLVRKKEKKQYSGRKPPKNRFWGQ